MLWSQQDGFDNTAVLKGHSNAITALTWTNSERLLSAGADKSVVNWDVEVTTKSLSSRSRSVSTAVTSASSTMWLLLRRPLTSLPAWLMMGSLRYGSRDPSRKSRLSPQSTLSQAFPSVFMETVYLLAESTTKSRWLLWETVVLRRPSKVTRILSAACKSHLMVVTSCPILSTKPFAFGMSVQPLLPARDSRRPWVDTFKATRRLWFEEDGRSMDCMFAADRQTNAYISGIRRLRRSCRDWVVTKGQWTKLRWVRATGWPHAATIKHLLFHNYQRYCYDCVLAHQ